MYTVLSRPTPLGSPSSPTPLRAPRKSTSFLSLRREKEKPAPLYADASHDPSGSKPSYFDAYPRPRSSRATNKAKREPAPALPVPPSPTSPDDLSFSDHTLREPKHAEPHPDVAYIFPTNEPIDYRAPSSQPKSRGRSKTGPSRKPSEWEDPPSLRFSGSSTQNGETPPDTPVDNVSFRDFHVSVAAPVSGVETMDALVDGMNGGEDMMMARSRFGIPGHHPLYQPPLPTPPPGVVLGGGKARKPKRSPRPPAPAYRASFSEDEEEDEPVPSTPHKRRPKRPTRSSSNGTITLSISAPPDPPSLDSSPVHSGPPTPLSRRSSRDSFNTPSIQERPKSVAPSISDIIRAYAPVEAKARSRASLHRAPSYAHSHDHSSTVQEESEPEPEPLTREEEAELLSRSSIDSVADEVQRTLRNQSAMKPLPPPPPPPPSSFNKRHSTMSDNTSLYSPRSDGGSASIYSMSAPSSSQAPPSPFENQFFASLAKPAPPSQAVAQYLRSARLTTLLKLTRSPHASQDNPLTVSLSDLGNPSGIPVVVFLGLGCVRHIMGLYDEMAECLGLRLITIDRWGLGRTEPRAKSAKGIMQWASVVEEVLDLLHIDECSVMAHSAGAPYALSFANKLRKRVRGDICLLAPWVGGSENGGYKWLKYVPNGLLKTAQAAEWKLQAWMIGKPPTIAYEGIGFNLQPPSKSPSRSGSPTVNHSSLNPVHPPSEVPRPSMTSSTFSEYDDLRDFDGRFESRSTLGAGLRPERNNDKVAKRKNSRGFLDRFKGPATPPMPSAVEDKPQNTGRRLKALRSMSSLRSKASSTPSKSSEPSSPQLPPALKFDTGLGFDDLSWSKSGGSSQTSLPSRGVDPYSTPEKYSSTGQSPYRVNGRRSLSFHSPSGPMSLPSSPQETMFSSNASLSTGSNVGVQVQDGYQAALANALLAASHAESAKGTHNDLLQILNHDNHPWGFSYTSYPHEVRVWYGDRDERIAANAVRWMEKTMGEDRCTVNVVAGADHGMMYKSSVVVEVLEHLLGFWQTDRDRD